MQKKIFCQIERSSVKNSVVLWKPCSSSVHQQLWKFRPLL